MGHGKSKGQRRIEQQIDELEIKKRSGLVRMVFAIVFFAALIVVKTGLASAGVAWANDSFVNAGFFILAVVFAAVAGLGSRAWSVSNRKIKDLRAQMRS